VIIDYLQALLVEQIQALGAVAAAVWHQTDPLQGGVLLASAPMSLLPFSPWPPIPGPDQGWRLEQGGGPAAVPTALRLELACRPTAAAVANLDDDGLGLLLVWAQGAPPTAALDLQLPVLQRGLAPVAAVALHHHQVGAREAQRDAAVSTFDQAVVVVDEAQLVGYANGAAARLLRLPEGQVAPAELVAALPGLQQRALDRAAVAAPAAQLARDPQAVIAGSVWSLAQSPTHLRVRSAPYERRGHRGRTWVFDDVSAIMRAAADAEHARAALAISQEQYRLLAGNAAAVVFRGDADGRLLWLSPSVRERLGWKPAERVNRPVLELVHPDDRAAVAPVPQALRQGHGAEFEVRLQRPDGGYRWLAIAVRPVPGTDTALPGWVGGGRDIQAEVEGRLALRQSRDVTEQAQARLFEVQREQYYRLFATSSDLMCIADAEGRFTEINPGGLEALGYGRDEIMGRSFLDFVHLDDLAATRDAYRAQSDQGYTMGFENRYRRRDGSMCWLSWRAFVDERNHQLYGVARDITARRRVEAQLRASESRLRSITEAAQDAIVMLDADGRVSHWNPAATRLLGYSLSEALGADLHELLATPEQCQAQRRILAAGFDAYVAKPVDLRLLLSALDSLLRPPVASLPA
jgi:PAS domain S-box-containing protein